MILLRSNILETEKTRHKNKGKVQEGLAVFRSPVSGYSFTVYDVLLRCGVYREGMCKYMSFTK